MKPTMAETQELIRCTGWRRAALSCQEVTTVLAGYHP